VRILDLSLTEPSERAGVKGQQIGYVRVSSFDQVTDRQFEHTESDRVFTHTAAGAAAGRPQLQALLAYVRDGDTVVIHSIDRLARNVDDLRRIVQSLTKRGVRVRLVKESLTFTGEDSPIANLMLTVLGAVAQFERDLIRERQREGIAIAQQRGVYRGRRRALAPEKVTELARRAAAGEKKAALAREFGISRETLYQYMREADARNPELVECAPTQ
jgi:DNA invertase Pin-like site-specific DNA recombinase